MKMQGFIMGLVWCPCRSVYRLAFVFFKIKINDLGPMYGGRNLNHPGIGYGEKAMVKGPVVAPAEAQSVPGIIGSIVLNRNDMRCLRFD
jgi:hypothetical protein